MEKELKLDCVRIAQENEREYIRIKDNSLKARNIKKNKAKKTISKSLYMLGGAAIMATSIFAWTQKVGADNLGENMKNIIEQNYDVVTEKYDPSMLALMQNGNSVNKEEALNNIIINAKELGFTEGQIYIGLDNYYKALNVDKKIERPNLIETINIKKEAFLNNELKKGTQK